MPADKLRVEYNTLNDLSKSFGQESHDIQQMIWHTTQAAEQLYQSGWRGPAADAFYREASEVVFPATSQLAKLLQEVAEVIVACLKIYYEADQAVGQLFHRDASAASQSADKSGQAANPPANKPAEYDAHAGAKAVATSYARGLGSRLWSMAKSAVVNTALGPIGAYNTLRDIGKSVVNGYHEGGVLGAINSVNPVYHLMVGVYDTKTELDKASWAEAAGNHEAAMRHYNQAGDAAAGATIAGAETVAVAVGGAKLGAGMLEGGGAAEAGANAAASSDRLFTSSEIDAALEEGNMRAGTYVQADAKGPLKIEQTPSDNLWYHERVEVPGVGPGGKDVAIRTHSPNPNAPEGKYSHDHYSTQVDTIQNNPRHVVDVDPDGNLVWKTWRQMTEDEKNAMHWPAE